jgi:MazG family protein
MQKMPKAEKIAIKTDDDFAHAIEKLKWVMACLRDPINGCPWDKEQDFKSILKYTIEEAYEVADAIENEDMDELKDELGDLLLQVIYYTQMSAEQNGFTFDDVAKGVADKMISRHPHVFGDKDALSAADVNEIWDAQKDKEQQSGGALDHVTKGLPALLRAQKLQKKAAKTGFEWPTSDAAFLKIEEEIAEFKEAKTLEHREEELGDLLFCLVNYARMQGLDAEEALRKANKKFVTRFKGMEADCTKDETDFSSLSLEEMLALWEKQKAK